MHSLGPPWMDPQYLLSSFGSQFFWFSALIVFIECGLLFPLLPGDSLLFAVGLFISTGQVHVNIAVACVVLSAAAFLGNVVGYEIGRAVGTPLYDRDGRILRQKYFDQTTAFFEHHGNKALVIGRFVPVIRHFISVPAGMGKMPLLPFCIYTVVGATLWNGLLLWAGYKWQENVEKITPYYKILDVVVVVAGIAVVAGWIYLHKRKPEKVTR